MFSLIQNPSVCIIPSIPSVSYVPRFYLLRPDICHEYHELYSWRKIVMWRNFSFPCMTIVGKLKISPHVEKFQMSPHDRCGEIWNSPHMACVWCRKRRHICKIYAIFATIYTLSCGEKLSPKVHLWRKMTNIRSAFTKHRHICKIYAFFCNLGRFVAKSVIHAVLSRNFM